MTTFNVEAGGFGMRVVEIDLVERGNLQYQMMLQIMEKISNKI
jgi:hypothetical protein